MAVREVQGEGLLDLGYRLRMYGGRVVPDHMLGGAVVSLGGTFPGSIVFAVSVLSIAVVNRVC